MPKKDAIYGGLPGVVGLVSASNGTTCEMGGSMLRTCAVLEGMGD